MPKYGLLLTHGAGSDRTSSQLIAIEDAVSDAVTVHRMDFPYRKEGRKAPDRQPVLLASLIEEAAVFARKARIKPEHLFLGGRSMGGRMCSIAVAEGLAAQGLALISYPLHPPGRPDKLRVDHFGDITVPCLFVSGTRDSFGTQAEIRRYLRRIKSPKKQAWMEGGDHGLKTFDADVAGVTSKWLRAQIAHS